MSETSSTRSSSPRGPKAAAGDEGCDEHAGSDDADQDEQQAAKRIVDRRERLRDLKGASGAGVHRENLEALVLESDHLQRGAPPSGRRRPAATARASGVTGYSNRGIRATRMTPSAEISRGSDGGSGTCLPPRRAQLADSEVLRGYDGSARGAARRPHREAADEQ